MAGEAEHDGDTQASMTRGMPQFWIWVSVLGAVALGLGVWGWSDLLYLGDAPLRAAPDDALGMAAAGFDIVSRSIKALLLSDIYYEEFAVDDPRLWWARHLGLLVSLLAAGRLLIMSLGAKAAALGLRAWRGHDVVIGEHDAAYAYSGQLETRTIHVRYDAVSQAGPRAVLLRDATVARELKDSGAARARRIVIAEATDAETWRTAAEVQRELPDAEIVLHVSDFWANERFSRSSGLRTFSYPAGVARKVMLDHPPYLLASRLGAPAQHIVVFGFGQVGEALLREFLITSVCVNPSRMMATIVCENADAAREDWFERHPFLASPDLGTALSIAFVQGNAARLDGALEKALRQRFEMSPPCAVYVAIEDDAHPMRIAIAINDRARRTGLFMAPILVWRGAGLDRVRPGAGLLGRLDPHGNPKTQDDTDRKVAPITGLGMSQFGSWRDCFDGEGLLEETLDGHARSYHEAYLALATAAGEMSGAAQQGWKDLPEEFRVSNRRAAAHMRAKLFSVGYPLGDWLDAADARRSDALPDDDGAREAIRPDDAMQLSMLGELEHRRWVLDRALNGWQGAAVRDNFRKRHPQMRLNRYLPPQEKEKDRQLVRRTATIVSQMMAKPVPGSGRKRR